MLVEVVGVGGKKQRTRKIDRIAKAGSVGAKC
jgi:hypothetical protein